ncbi:MBL fold metallo-hydrolase [Gramella lutea]|uniref:MBL fold metallo-hydrolase n=1 Tax=Christiangramia lutea TaxID=1607951 RepID=A0A9X2AA29_9FLAO|nr:MBL fold metallo-hydrolase [Christiangramia lutea]MCH4824259.1 MBL fold metallo-hydrolase [Christiangramia lutea]
MKRLASLLAIVLMFTACKDDAKNEDEKTSSEIAENNIQTEMTTEITDLEIDPISHATAVFKWNNKIFYTDPVGGAKAFKNKPKPDFILITDIHGDHMNAETLLALELGETEIIVPKAVQKELPEELQSNLIILKNGESHKLQEFEITAVPMYNLPQSNDAMHVKGRGNGYIAEKNGKRLYISGDTEDIPEMRNLKEIDVALISMNLPYTMPVEQAADGVLAFKPKKVIPYHYRGKNGFSDVEEFKRLVNKGSTNIQVELMDWYPSK